MGQVTETTSKEEKQLTKNEGRVSSLEHSRYNLQLGRYANMFIELPRLSVLGDSHATANLI